MLLERLAHGRSPTVVIFDLDGTLINSLPDLASAIDLMLGDLNLSPADESEVRQWVGNGAVMLVKRALHHSLSKKGLLKKASPEKTVSPNQLDCAMHLFYKHYQRQCAQRTHLYPGVFECLNQLHKREIKMAVVTNKPRQFVQPIPASFSHRPILFTGGCWR